MSVAGGPQPHARREWRLEHEGDIWLLLRAGDLRPEERARVAAVPALLLDRWMRDPLRRDVLHAALRAVGSLTDASARPLDRRTVERHVVMALARALREGVLVALRRADDALGRIRTLTVPPPPPLPPPPPPPPPVNPVVTIPQPVVLVKHGALTPRRQPVRLGTDAAFDGTGTLTLAGAGRVRFFDAATAGNEVPLNGAANVFPGARLTSGVTLYAEGVGASAGLHDVRLTLSLTGGSRPTGPDAVGTMTALEVIVDIHQSRTTAAAAPAALSQADKVAVGRFVHKQYGDKHGRAMVTLRKGRPHAYNGDLRLEALGGVKLFDAERGGAEVALPHTVGNGVIPAAPTDGLTFWLEGRAVSAALRDAGLKVGAEGDPEGDLARATVVEFRRVRATVTQTPPNTARLGNGPVADVSFEHGAAPAASDYDVSSAANAPLVLLEGSTTAAAPVRLDVDVAPAGVSVRWDAHRDDRALPDGDHPDVVTLSPRAAPTLTPDGADPLRATLAADAVGTFHVRPYVDCNGSGRYEHGVDLEPCTVLNVALVRARLSRDRSAAHNTLVAAPGAGGIGVRSGAFNINAPATEAMHMLAEVDLLGGGGDGRRGVDQVFAGWVNNETRNENIVGTFVDRTVAPAVTLRMRSVFATNAASATGAAAAGRAFLPGDPAPALLAPPLLDTGRPGAGSGGDTATLTRSRVKSRTPLAAGERLVVESVDSPGDGDGPTHPARPAARLETFHFELDFQASLCLWVNRARASGATGDPCDRLYVVALEVPWRMLGEWSVNPATGAVTVVVAPAVTKGAAVTHSPAVPVAQTAVEVRPPTGLSLLARDAR